MSTTTDAIRALAARMRGRKVTGRLAKRASTAAATALVAGVTLALTTAGGTTALWTGSATIQPPSITSGSITAYLSDLSPLTTTFTSSALSRTTSLVVDNTGTALASASLRLTVGAGSSSALAASTTVTMWEVTDPSTCTETAVPVGGWTAAWNAFPLLTGTLAPGEHETFCVRSRTASSNLTSSASITPTVTLSLGLSGTQWTSTASTSATLSVAADRAVVGNDYTAAVRADGANRYWRLGESSGRILYDLVGTDDAYAGTGLTRGIAGPNSADANAATTFSGDANGTAGTRAAGASPQSFAVEAWFKTTSTTGGKIIGFGGSSSGLSYDNDRHIYLDAAGHVSFGVWTGAASTITTPGVYNDGNWHHVVGNLGAGGQELYVDGDQVGSTLTAVTSGWAYTGYWRIGGDTTWGGDQYFDGTIDEVAVYSAPLTSLQAKRHYAIPTGIPVAAFTSSATDYTASVNASTSSDYAGSIASYSWNWGDGTATGTGVTASHVYAVKGTYPVTLTVTDNSGNTDTVTRSVYAADVTPPTRPSNLVVTGNTGYSVSLSWTGSTDTVGVVAYDIYRNGTLLKDFATGTTWTDTQRLTLGTAYSYQVRARDAAGNSSEYSNAASVTTAPIDTTSWYTLTASNALCVGTASTDEAAPLTQSTCAAGSAWTSPTLQNFKFVPATTAGYYQSTLRAAPTMVWDVGGASTVAGAPIKIGASHAGTNQQWQLTAVGTNVYTFKALNSGMCLAVPGGTATAGTQLVQEVCVTGAANQQFTVAVAP